MSTVSILQPKINLPKKLREPGGVPLSDALEQANKNLAAASAGYMKELAAGVAEIAEMAKAASAADASTFVPIYQRAGALIGIASVCGRPSIDAALASLCELLDHFQNERAWDAEALSVHVNALRLLLQHAEFEGGPGAAAILDGLQKISRRYAADKP